MFTEKNMLSHVARPRPILHFIRRSMEFITCKCARRVATSLGRSASLCAAVEQRCARRLLFVSTLGAPHPMDWEPVPALTLPSAALTARGADHDR